MLDIKELEKCNGLAKVPITYCKLEQLWQVMAGRVNGKLQCCRLWELPLKRLRYHYFYYASVNRRRLLLQWLRLSC